MGSRDYRHREVKKPSKSGRQLKVEALTPTQETEVVKKKKSKKDEEA